MLGGSSFPPELKYFCLLLGVRKLEHDAADPKTCLHHFLPQFCPSLTDHALALNDFNHSIGKTDRSVAWPTLV